MVNGLTHSTFVGNLRAHSLFLDLRTFAPSSQASEDRYVTPLLGPSDPAALSPLMDTSLRVLGLRGTALVIQPSIHRDLRRSPVVGAAASGASGIKDSCPCSRLPRYSFAFPRLRRLGFSIPASPMIVSPGDLCGPSSIPD